MKLDEKVETIGLFGVFERILTGLFKVEPDKSIEIVLTCNELIPEIGFNGKTLKIIYGTIKESSKKITIIDGLIFQSHLSSNGIFEYTIKSNLVIIGDFVEENDLTIDNISLISEKFSNFIGNSLITAKYNYNTHVASFEIPFKRTINEEEFENYKIKIDAFNNVDKYSIASSFNVKQINSISIKLHTPLEIYKALDFVSIVESFLTFSLGVITNINEIVYFKKVELNGKIIESFNHIYYRHDIIDMKKVNEQNVIIQKNELQDKFCIFLNNWIMRLKDIPYLKHFMLHYYQTKYIDQKIIAQVNLIESLHKYYFGIKKDDQEIQDVVLRITSQISDSEDKELIKNLIESKNNYGLRRKIKDIASKVSIGSFSSKDIDLIAQIRSSFAHGGVMSGISIDRYIELNNKLNKIINKVIKEIICQLVPNTEFEHDNAMS